MKTKRRRFVWPILLFFAIAVCALLLRPRQDSPNVAVVYTGKKFVPFIRIGEPAVQDTFTITNLGPNSIFVGNTEVQVLRNGSWESAESQRLALLMFPGATIMPQGSKRDGTILWLKQEPDIKAARVCFFYHPPFLGYQKLRHWITAIIASWQRKTPKTFGDIYALDVKLNAQSPEWKPFFDTTMP